MAMSFVQGRYNPDNPKKYIGDVNNIVYRSSYERVAFQWIDREPNIVAWSSEERVIPYFSPVDNKMHRYFCDLEIYVKQPSGPPKRFLIEIKPYDQTIKPRKTKTKKDTTFLNEVMTYAVNQAKWKAARAWCQENNADFIIWTEKELFPSQQTRRYKHPKK